MFENWIFSRKFNKKNKKNWTIFLTIQISILDGAFVPHFPCPSVDIVSLDTEPSLLLNSIKVFMPEKQVNQKETKKYYWPMEF